MEKYKLKYTIYHNGDENSDRLEVSKLDDCNILFAKKGQVAKRLEVTNTIRKKYSVYDERAKTIYLFNNGKIICCKNKYSDVFEKIKKNANQKSNEKQRKEKQYVQDKR